MAFIGYLSPVEPPELGGKEIAAEAVATEGRFHQQDGFIEMVSEHIADRELRAEAPVSHPAVIWTQPAAGVVGVEPLVALFQVRPFAHGDENVITDRLSGRGLVRAAVEKVKILHVGRIHDVAVQGRLLFRRRLGELAERAEAGHIRLPGEQENFHWIGSRFGRVDGNAKAQRQQDILQADSFHRGVILKGS